MAVQKNWRKIIVDEKLYFWKAIGQDGGIDGVIVTEEAFICSQLAQQLLFKIEYNHHKTPLKNGMIRLRQQVAISPSVIRLAIEIAISKSPPFTGERGKENIILKNGDVQLLQEKAHIKR